MVSHVVFSSTSSGRSPSLVFGDGVKGERLCVEKRRARRAPFCASPKPVPLERSSAFIFSWWPELDKLFANFNCRPEDRPDLLSRIFKIKLKELIRDVTSDMLFGKQVQSSTTIYTIELHKCGLPHVHILSWLAPKDKFTLASQINSVIFTEIPNPNAHPQYTNL
ncbi:helicase-like protein [Senna tora]|uniref:Helicase-like protein n=1 Tax=Senna tora TaxID=362788 RepID=A0A834W6N9_9FABA|nr:helicase-like protein [Senna tora]